MATIIKVMTTVWARLYDAVCWHLARVQVRVLGLVGHWEWEHEFKTCPTGDRHCPHIHYKLGR